MTPWPHQLRGCAEVVDHILADRRRICLTSPTGGGKTLMMQILAKHFLENGKAVALYTNRRMLVEQTSAALMEAGIYHGVRSAGYEDERDHPFQISSLQTENSRVLKKGTWKLHDAQLVLVDEAHIQTGPTAVKLIDQHHEEGAAVVGFTATPLGIGDIYNTLVVAGTMSELRACGALVLSYHHAPDEPDLKAFKKLREGQDLTENQNRSAMMTPSIFGRVWEWFGKLNPEQKPTLLFGPGVNESLWFAEQFAKKGIRAAHIDGNDVWMDGNFYRADTRAREDLRERSKDGTIKVVCNRYVLREGVDWPWVQHLILAFVAGSLQTYIQVGGRGLRAYPGKDRVVIQDHGGAWWRHGSLNADRAWRLEETADVAYGLRAQRIRNKKQEQPFRCPQCGRTWTAGRECRVEHGGCGFVLPKTDKLSRPVVSTDGVLHELTGDVFRPHRISKAPNGAKLWERMYYRSRTEKGSRTFAAAAALFAMENRWGWPDPSWPFMPTDELDWFRLVAQVPIEKLVPKESPAEAS